ncbi:MAG: hypothetical protein Q3983_06585 [Capnocytophaga sp.]|nr:hypothetical protein [Capnocytophaga sp.]
MLKKIITLLFLGFYIFSFAQEDIRSAFIVAASSKENAKKFYELMNENKQNNSINQAYLGASEIIFVRFFPDRRTNYLRRGKQNIEEAISENPNSLEIRLIRLSVQENLPKVVPYRKNIEEDKKMLIENYAQQSTELQQYIKGYVQKSKSFTEEEKKIFK